MLSRQDYLQTGIKGVEIRECKRFIDDTGSFNEIARASATPYLQSVKQINFTTVWPGAIKAYHLHKRQTDIWFIPPTERILIALVDCRDEHGAIAPTKQSPLRRYVFGDGTARVLIIPPGVAHGYRNMMSRDGVLFYMVTEEFDPQPEFNDEYRLPWNFFGAQVWEPQHG